MNRIDWTDTPFNSAILEGESTFFVPPPPAKFTSGTLSRLYFRVVPDDPVVALLADAGALVVGAGVLAVAILLSALADIVVLVDNARLVNDVVAATAMPFKKPRRGKLLTLDAKG